MNNTGLNISYLPPDKTNFYFNENGFLIAEINGENIGRVKLIRTYPYTLLDEYICVHTLDDNEVGIIRDLKALSESSLEATRKELENRYYCPTVTAVKTIKERMGHFYFETLIDGKEKNFTVKDLTKNLRFSGEDTLLIFDVDGNRYIIPRYEKIEPKSRRILEPYLY